MQVRDEVFQGHGRGVVRPFAPSFADPDQNARAVDQLGWIATGIHACGIDVSA